MYTFFLFLYRENETFRKVLVSCHKASVHDVAGSSVLAGQSTHLGQPGLREPSGRLHGS